MEEEFTISIYWKIIYGALAIGLAGFSIFDAVSQPAANRAAIIIPFVLVIVAILVVINMIRSKIIISDYNIIRTTVWGTKELNNNNVKGYRIGDKAIYIKSINGDSKITIRDYTAVGNNAAFIECLRAHYVDLDAVEYVKEHETILNDTALGFSKEEREEKFKKAKQIALFYNIGGIALVILSVFLFKSSQLINFLLLLYPLIGVVIICLSNGLVRLISKKNSAYFNIIVGLYLSVIVLTIKSIVDYHVFQYDNIKLPFITIGAILFVVLYIFSVKKSNFQIIAQLFMATLISFGYSFGSVIQINCAFDKSEPITYSPIVLNQHIQTGKKNIYYLNLGPWGGRTYAKDIQVDYSIYQNVTIGQHVNIDFKKGLLNIPWYYLPQ